MSGCGDKQGAVGCFSGDIEKGLKFPITSGKEYFDDPKIPNYLPSGKPNPAEPGISWVKDLIADIKAEIKAAESDAVKACKDPKSCCRTIVIDMKPLKSSYAEITDVQDFLRQSESGRKVMNYQNTLTCGSGAWRHKKIDQ